MKVAKNQLHYVNFSTTTAQQHESDRIWEIVFCLIIQATFIIKQVANLFIYYTRNKMNPLKSRLYTCCLRRNINTGVSCKYFPGLRSIIYTNFCLFITPVQTQALGATHIEHQMQESLFHIFFLITLILSLPLHFLVLLKISLSCLLY